MPRKYINRTTLIIAAAVIAVAAVIASVMLTSRPADEYKPTVTIEVRTQKRARVKIDGNAAGFAPRGFVVPFSTMKTITIEVDMAHGRTATKTVMPDQNQVVDL
ncbi:MAG TPA: hypothetical protein VH143_07175 [Kofleriaceae bacterium]|nr:hypothetical protein [Kofleriaceae bacterium]